MNEIICFNSKIAEAYGINAAVILQHIWYWVRHNETNNVNFHDGTYWTFNSAKAFNLQFPYLTQKQIETALKKLKDEGIIVTGNYNENKYDRTLWYSITNKGKSILPSGEIEITPEGNRNYSEVEPIPNINQYKPNNINIPPYPPTGGSKEDIPEEYINNSNGNNKEGCGGKKKGGSPKQTGTKGISDECGKIIDAYTNDSALRSVLRDFVSMRLGMRNVPFSANAMKLALKALDKLAYSPAEKTEIVNQSILNGWRGLFALQSNGGGTNNAKRPKYPDPLPGEIVL